MNNRIEKVSRTRQNDDVPDETWLDRSYQQMSQRFDEEYGGFGDSPKFPRVMDIQLLFRLDKQDRFSESDSMIRHSLDGMMRGGIYDQVGGGFSRYSTDRKWLVPHFEKMLYDNAQLLDVYTTGYRVFEDKDYRDVVERTYNYMVRDLGHPEGAFYSSQDAESEGEEGKYYVWTEEEFHDVLGEKSDLLADFWDVSSEGNFEGKCILHRTRPIDDFCEENGLDGNEFRSTLVKARKKLLEVREQRTKPHLDDKILTNWNGLALAACARAGFVLDEEDFLERAENGLDFLLDVMTEGNELYHTHREGETHTPAFLDDYAFLVKALLEVFQVTGNFERLDQAKTYFDRAVDIFWDEDDGGFFFASDRHENLIVRSKNPQEKAQPSGNSEMILNALKLRSLLEDDGYRIYAEETLKAFEYNLEQSAISMTRLLCGLHDYYADSVEVVSVEQEGSDDLLNPIRERYIPGSVLLRADANSITKDQSPLLEGRLDEPVPAVYLCTNGTCRQPATAVDELGQELTELSVYE